MKNFPYDLRTLSVAHKVANQIALTVADAEWVASRFADPLCEQMEKRLLGGPDMEELTLPYRPVRPFIQSEHWKAVLTDGKIEAPALDDYENPELENAIEKEYIAIAEEIIERLVALEDDDSAVTEADGEAEETKARRPKIDVQMYDLDHTIMPPTFIDRIIERIAGVARPLLAKFIQKVGLRAMIDARVDANQGIAGISFDIDATPATSYLANAAHKIGRDSVTIGYVNEIRQAMVEGISKGEDTRRLRQRIEKLTNRDIVGYRAQRIARTESAFAEHHAAIEGWKQSGVVVAKKYVLSAEPCEVCIAIAEKLGRDGDRDTTKAVPLDEPFFKTNTLELEPVFTLADGTKKTRKVVLDYTPDGAYLTLPPVHPNCRCSVRPVIT